MNLGLSFLRGLTAAVNPCAFVLLPTFLVYFLGTEAAGAAEADALGVADGRSPRASVRRALFVSSAVSAGFIGMFVVAGVVTNFFTSWLASNAKYVTLVIGLGLVVLGVAMLFGYRLPIATPSIDGARDRTVRSMFVYGVGYGLASLSCTIGLFMGTAFSSPDSFVDGVANVVAYGLGMALIVIALTVSLAVANHALLRVLRAALRYVNSVAAAFVLLSGLYLLWYFWVVDVNQNSDAATDAVERLQTWVQVQLNDHWQTVAAVLAAVVGAAVGYVWLRRRPEDAAPLPSAARDEPSLF